jgi:hypothetical protein
MTSLTNNKTPRISVSRNAKVLGEYHPLQMGSLIETGHLQNEDLCLDPESSQWIPISEFMLRIPEYSPKHSAETTPPAIAESRQGDRKISGIILLLGFIALIAAWGALFWSGKISAEIDDLKTRLAKAEAATSEWKQKYENVLFAAREVASNDLVRGKVIMRDATGKRVVLPDVKVRLYRRAEIEAYLSDRYARIAESGGTDPNRLSTHFLKSLPAPIETSTTDSDGRFECKIPRPGEYVIQTGIRSAKTGELRLWFVTFDSRDPLNTPVDITESNVVRQFNPIFMLNEGR